MNIELELTKVITKIKDSRPSSVLIQLPDGLKPKAKEIVDAIEAQTQAKVYIHLGSCFGACDVPNIKNIDLLIQWGHSEFI